MSVVHELTPWLWECTYLGRIRWILNMRITTKPGVLIIDQSEYVSEILAQFGLTNAKPVSTPAQLGLHLTKKDMCPDNLKDKQKMQMIPYNNAVGKTLYLRLTRIDILAAIAECARFMANPGKAHWQAIKRIMRYLSGTRHWGLIYRKTGKTLDDEWEVTMYVRGLKSRCGPRPAQITLWIPHSGKRMSSSIWHRHEKQVLSIHARS